MPVKHSLLCGLFLAGISLALFTTCEQESERIQRGRQLTEQHCARCHYVPRPADLPKRVWATDVLPLMGAFLSVYGSEPRSAYLAGGETPGYLAGVFPLEPVIDSLDWVDLQNYFIEEAPVELPSSEQAAVVRQMDQFQLRRIPHPDGAGVTALTTLIHFDPANKRIVAGGKRGGDGELFQFDNDHQLNDSRALSSPPTAFDSELEATLEIGTLEPSDRLRGYLTTTDDTLRRELARPVDMALVDLDLDGSPETVIAEYGNYRGQLEAVTKDGFRYGMGNHPGSIALAVADLDGDGHDDVVTLQAQGRERVIVHYARPDGPSFDELYLFPASYGSSDLKVVDFDGDGDLDILTTNGDNFDYQPVPKPYHGIRLLENDGGQRFTQTWFYPLDGAYGLEVDDFDGDGDMDIAAIAYFVPQATRSIHSFVYLEQYEELAFHAFGFEKKTGEHYLCMTKGDTDGDGDQDLLLGNFSAYLPDGYNVLKTARPSPIYLHLENLSVR